MRFRYVTVQSAEMRSSDSSLSRCRTASTIRSADARPITRVAFETNFATVVAVGNGTSGEPKLAALRLRTTRPSARWTMTSPVKRLGKSLAGSSRHHVFSECDDLGCIQGFVVKVAELDTAPYECERDDVRHAEERAIRSSDASSPCVARRRADGACSQAGTRCARRPRGRTFRVARGWHRRMRG